METIIYHPAIKDGQYDYSLPKVIKHVNQLSDAVEYFNGSLSDQINAIRENAILEFGKSPKKGIIPLPHQISFYSDHNFEGDSFQLGVIAQTKPEIVLNPPILAQCDWESNLESIGMNDRITSINSHVYPKYWLLCEHVGFKGRNVIGNGSTDNLAIDIPGWNDFTSSIIMCSVSSDFLRAALNSLA